MPSGETAVGCRAGMIRRVVRQWRIALEGPIVLQINDRLSAQLRALAIANGSASVETWCEEALETYVVDARSGKAPRVAVDHCTAQQDGEVW